MRTAMLFVLVLGAMAARPAERARAQSVEAAEAAPAAPGRWRPENFLGANLMGFAGFLRVNVGSFEVYYERNFEQHHAVQLAGDFIHVHQAAAHRQIHLWTFGGSLTYRYYFGPGVGPFVGAQVGYRRGFGRDAEGGDHHVDHDGATRLEIEQWRALGQVGYRFFAPELGLTIVPRVGLGYGEHTVTGGDDPIAQARALYARDVLAPTALVVDLELSIGVAF